MPGTPGKIRAREHVLADLSVNFVERHILLCRFAALRVFPDYGYDVVMFTYNDLGEIEPGMVFFQLKATDDLPLLKDGRTITWPISRRDLKLWLSEAYPVILVIYDGQREKAYWLDVQDYFANRSTTELFTDGNWINVRIPVSNRLNSRALLRLAQHKRSVHQKILRKEDPNV